MYIVIIIVKVYLDLFDGKNISTLKLFLYIVSYFLSFSVYCEIFSTYCELFSAYCDLNKPTHSNHILGF